MSKLTINGCCFDKNNVGDFKTYSVSVMRIRQRAINSGIDMDAYIRSMPVSEYYHRLKLILEGLKADGDITPLLNMEMNNGQLHALSAGVNKGLILTPYCDDDTFSSFRIDVLILAIEDGVDLKHVVKPDQTYNDLINQIDKYKVMYKYTTTDLNMMVDIVAKVKKEREANE